MNQLMIVLLAVCLVSVHAFVKRDTPQAPPTNELDNFGKEITDFLKKTKAELEKTFNPDKVKNDFSAMVDQLSAIIQPKNDAPKA